MTLAMNTVETAVDVVGAGSLTSRFGFFGRSAEAVVDDPWCPSGKPACVNQC